MPTVVALPFVLGLHLGAPLNLPECQREAVEVAGMTPPYLSPIQQPRECVEHLREPSGRTAFVDFPPSSGAPPILADDRVMVQIIGGRLAGIDFQTPDYNNADAIVAVMGQKFGKFSDEQVRHVDLDTIAVPSRVVTWRNPGYRVEYHSVSDNSVEHGWVVVETDEEAALSDQERQRALAEQQRF